MGLSLDYTKLIRDFSNYFYKELEIALDSWKQEVESHIMSNFIKKHGNPQVDKYIKKETNGLKAFLQANPAVLADAYGTGSLMNITDNPHFREYKNSEYWNPARHGKEIVGRPEGTYTDIFGREKHSSGYLEGIKIEHTKVGIPGKENFSIEPIPPSNSIKIANDLLYKTYLPRAIKNARDSIKFSNYVIEVK